jgi:hypothetical protein
MPVVTMKNVLKTTIKNGERPTFNAERRFYSKYGGGIGKKSPARKFQLYAKNPSSNFLES